MEGHWQIIGMDGTSSRGSVCTNYPVVEYQFQKGSVCNLDEGMKEVLGLFIPGYDILFPYVFFFLRSNPSSVYTKIVRYHTFVLCFWSSVSSSIYTKRIYHTVVRYLPYVFFFCAATQALFISCFGYSEN